MLRARARARARALSLSLSLTLSLTLTRSVDEPPAPGAAFTGADRARDAAVFAALGEGDLKINAKRLFCLCDGAPEFESMIQRYMDSISILAGCMSAVALITSTWFLCLCCCIEDTDRYYDPELL
jgi:hypothetical protein